MNFHTNRRESVISLIWNNGFHAQSNKFCFFYINCTYSELSFYLIFNIKYYIIFFKFNVNLMFKYSLFFSFYVFYFLKNTLKLQFPDQKN